MRIGRMTSGFAVMLLLAVGSAQAQQGAQIYQQNCAVCHGPEGQGNVGPALAGNTNLQDATRTIRQILNGGQQMPPFRGTLSDEQIATVATHIRTTWGNDFGEVTAEQVSEQRSGAAPEGAGEEQPPEEQPPADQPPADQPPADQPPADQPPAEQPPAEEQPEEEQQAAAPAAEAVTVAASTEGDEARLVDGEGRTLYRFRFDGPDGVSHCYDPCVNRWLPVVVPDAATAGEGIDGAALATVEREDGSLQVTYNGWPLYRFVGDEQPGDALGDAISDVWTSVRLDIEVIGGSNGG